MAGIVPVILNKGRYAPDCVGADAPAKENELKNYLMFALLIGATASMAFGQFGVVVDPAKVDVACPDEECHVAPVFMGEGGFVGELADGFDMANFVVTCGNTTASGSAAGDGGGVVRQLFSMANGLACHSEGGSIQIHGLADGGWYWINDDMNSAVSPLIAKDALMGDEVMPTDPGGVTLMAGDYGTYVKSGDRVGILPHFVPTAPVEIPEIPEPEAATVCMPEWTGRAWIANNKDCMLGDGGTTIVMTARSGDGRSHPNVTSVHRNPSGGGNVEIGLDLWANGSGHVSGDENVFLGWNVPGGQGRTPESFEARWSASLAADDTLGTGLADAGVTLNPGKSVTIPGMKIVGAGPNGDGKPATEGGTDWDVLGTVLREDGYTKNSPDGIPQCTQAMESRTISGSGEKFDFILWRGADGGEVAIRSDDTANLPGQGDDLTTLAAWAVTFNARTVAGSKDIMTVTVREGEGADAVDRAIPAVICKMERDTDEDVIRYQGATIEISPSSDYCNDDNNRTAVVYVNAYDAHMSGNGNPTTPPISKLYPAVTSARDWRLNLNSTTALQVHCAE